MSAAADLCRRARAGGLFVPWDGAPALTALLVAGPDATSFLHAQLTSDVGALAPGEGQPSARLNRKGALVADFTLFRWPERGQPFPTFLMIVAKRIASVLLDDLTRHVVSDDVVVENAGAEFDGWLLQGPASPAACALIDGTESQTWLGLAEHRLTALAGKSAPRNTLAMTISYTGDAGFLLLQSAGLEPSLSRAVAACGLAPWPESEAGAQAWEWLRVEAGRPKLGVDLEPGQRALPQTGLEQSVVSYTKGCYLGQEVVARIRTYGSVSEALRGLLFTALPDENLPAFCAPGAPLMTADGSTIGTWGSGGYSTVWRAPIALAFVDRAHRTPGTKLTVRMDDGTGHDAEVRLLPFHQATGQADTARRLHERAVHRFSQGLDDEAIALLQDALRIDSSLVEAYEALGVILGRGGRFHEAIDIFKRLEEVAPHEPMVHTNLSLYYMKIGDKEEAERQKAEGTLKRFAGLDDAKQTADRASAATATRRLDAERKLAMFAEVLDIDPDDPLALMGLGNALCTLERFAEAEPHLARACARQKDNSPLYALHGKALEQLGRDQEALNTYREGVAVASRKGDLVPLREMEHRLMMLEAQA